MKEKRKKLWFSSEKKYKIHNPELYWKSWVDWLSFLIFIVIELSRFIFIFLLFF